MKVLSGLCTGGPKDRQMLASMQGVPGTNGRVTHASDPNGFYRHQPAQNGDPAKWIWIATNRKEKVE